MRVNTRAVSGATALLLVSACSAAVVGGCKGPAQKEADAKAQWNKPTDPNFVSEINAKRQSSQGAGAAKGTAPATTP